MAVSLALQVQIGEAGCCRRPVRAFRLRILPNQHVRMRPFLGSRPTGALSSVVWTRVKLVRRLLLYFRMSLDLAGLQR
jgi:hypothetical protein